MTGSAVDERAVFGLPPATRSARAWQTVLVAGVCAATIDIVFAFVFFGIRLGATPLRVLQTVASGLYGRASFDGGLGTAAVGLLAHYLILTVAAGVYLLASWRLPALNRRAVGAGLLFGLAIWIAMTFVIVPLSAAPMRPFAPGVTSAGQFLIHPVLGVAIALIVRRAARAS